MGSPEPPADAPGPEAFADLDRAALDAAATGDFAAADRLWSRALALEAAHPDALRNHGAVLRRLGRIDAALARYAQALALDPAHASARIARANLLNQLGRHAEALADARAALAAAPDDATALNALGAALSGLGRAADAATAWTRATERAPGYLDPHINLGNLALDRADAAGALAHYQRGAVLAPDAAPAWSGQGHALSLMGRWAEAAAAYDRAVALDADTPGLLGYRLHARMKLCDWTGFHAEADRIVQRLTAGRAACPPFPLLAMPGPPRAQRAAAELFARTLPPVARAPAPPRGPRLRIAYVSADFHAHATAWLIAAMLERHDRDAFEIIALSFGPATGDAMQQRLFAACDRVFDVRTLDDAAVVDLARGLGVDIAVDLKGYTTGARPGLFARGLAPVQVNYLGFPGTMAGAGLGYIIADPVVIPPGAEGDYAETVLRLGCYQPNDPLRPRPARRTTRADHGLPDDAFVFAAFNNPYKITPDVFAIWMDLLAAVPGAVLWLFADDGAAQPGLRAAAARAGVDPARLVFAPRAAHEAHLERHHHADLMLDTAPYTAHTTASDALWMGLPLVTCPAETFASRVAASLLTAAGLPDLIAGSWADYRELALALAGDAGRLAGVRARLEANRGACRLFDAATHVRELEDVYRRIAPA